MLGHKFSLLRLPEERRGFTWVQCYGEVLHGPIFSIVILNVVLPSTYIVLPMWHFSSTSVRLAGIPDLINASIVW